MSTGFVSLVGAGPGDPDLLTCRAVRRLRGADVVVYDALVQPEILAFARRATPVFVGKRARRPAVSQAWINAFLVRTARQGRTDVRLKGGDPFVLGRGGEEALALLAAGVPFEIVPGVTAATAAAALAGIPVTHRGRASGFVVVAGHAEEAYGPILRSLAPGSATVVVMMGLARINRLARLLLVHGWRPETPAAILIAISTSAAETRTTSLARLADSGPPDTGGHAGTVVIGEVVGVLRGWRGARGRHEYADPDSDWTHPPLVCERSGHR
jgi:uroporphyrin-III C-methyltransferase/precorrin-2 dehydrogenase/sirohydrochlorin ferrochelatase